MATSIAELKRAKAGFIAEMKSIATKDEPEDGDQSRERRALPVQRLGQRSALTPPKMSSSTPLTANTTSELT